MSSTEHSVRHDGQLRLPAALLALATVFAAGCGDSEIKTYRVAKDPADNPAAHVHAATAPHAQGGPVPHVHSTAPDGWQEIPAEGMRVASYQISGSNGRLANVSIIPLPGAGKIQLQSVNMWREELGLEPLSSEQQVKEQSEPVQVGDTQGILVDLVSTAPRGQNSFNTRTIGALAERGNIMWFVKMSGEETLVAEQKQAFGNFLKSIEFHEGAHGQVAAAEQPVSTNAEKLPEGSDAPKWNAPANWTQKTPGPMLLAAYTVTGENGEAEVTISKFPGDVGGMVANVNRWRGQLGLQPLPEAEARNSVERVEIDGAKDSYMVDVKGTNARTGKPARMVALGVPVAGETWFFKLLGDEAVVAKEKDAFVRFVVSAY